MDKREFLEVLRQSLNGEVKPEVIDQNIKYYDQYISSQSLENVEKILEELGDPRLISKSIIEADRAAKQKGRYERNNESYSNYYAQEDESENNKESQGHGNTVVFSSMKWYQKILVGFVILIIITIMIFIGRIIFSFLFAFGIPIILILLLLTLFKKRR